MKNIGTLLLVLGLSSAAFAASDLQTIQEQMADVRVGQQINPAAAKGQYQGTCYQGSAVTQEALYFDAFVDVKGVTKDLAISTLQTYGGNELPRSLQFLLQPGHQGWNFMVDLVKDGTSGTNNNLGMVAAGVDFKYLYSSDLQGTTFTVTVDQERQCITDAGRTFCNPPSVQACSYGYDKNNVHVFDGCERRQDQTVFKKLSDNTLISHRTAAAVGERTNNLSFYLPEISTFCKWTK